MTRMGRLMERADRRTGGGGPLQGDLRRAAIRALTWGGIEQLIRRPLGKCKDKGLWSLHRALGLAPDQPQLDLCRAAYRRMLDSARCGYVLRNQLCIHWLTGGNKAAPLRGSGDGTRDVLICREGSLAEAVAVLSDEDFGKPRDPGKVVHFLGSLFPLASAYVPDMRAAEEIAGEIPPWAGMIALGDDGVPRRLRVPQSRNGAGLVRRALAFRMRRGELESLVGAIEGEIPGEWRSAVAERLRAIPPRELQDKVSEAVAPRCEVGRDRRLSLICPPCLKALCLLNPPGDELAREMEVVFENDAWAGHGERWDDLLPPAGDGSSAEGRMEVVRDSREGL